MSRYKQIAVQDAPPSIDGEQHFAAMDMETPRELLPPGYYHSATNKRCIDGRLATRGGTVRPGFADLETLFRSRVMPFVIVGSGSYSNPNGKEARLIATPHLVYAIRDGTFPVEILIPEDVTLTAPCEFSQQFDKVLLHRGTLNVNGRAEVPAADTAASTLVWDGIDPEGFKLVTKSDPGNTVTSLIPNVDWSVNISGRAVIRFSRDSIACSDILDYSTFALGLDGNVFRVNSGTADEITAAIPYAQQSIIVGKRHSIDELTGFYGDLSQASMNVLSSTIGMCARKAAVMVGTDIIFPYDTGVYKISPVPYQNRMAVSPLPVATRRDARGNVIDPIGPLLRRINWAVADKQLAVANGVYYYWAVAIDGSTVNNAVAVLNTAKDNWESIDTWGDSEGEEEFQIDDLYVAQFQGARRVWAIDRNTKAIYVLYEGKSDLLADGEHEISDSFESRGYGAQADEQGRVLFDFKRVVIGLETWRPEVTVTAIFDGENNERLLTQVRAGLAQPITKDPAKYYQFGKLDYELNNFNGDWAAAGREDYSLPDGFYPDASMGVNPDQKQTRPEKFSLFGRGNWVSYRVENSQGQADILGIVNEAVPVGTETRRAG